MSKTHHLKIKYEYAQLQFRGLKDWELRKNDRDFKAGDTIIFSVLEFGFMYSRKITNVFDDFGLQEGFVLLSIS